jgi:CheY-like chemotaxis protein
MKKLAINQTDNILRRYRTRDPVYLSETQMYPGVQHILVIDSDAERRQLSAGLLADEGFAVTAVAEGFSAIRAAGARDFALALAAVELPGTLDGRATVRHVRVRQPWLKALYTGDAAQRPRCPALGCDDFIAAPFHRRDLLGCVFELLQRKVGHAPAVGRGCRHSGLETVVATPEPMFVLGAAALADLTDCRD